MGGFVRSKAAELAALGYVVLCPDVFWRTARGVAHPHDEAGLAAAMASMQRWSTEVEDRTALADLLSAFEHLQGLPEVGARATGVMGYCLGGRLAFEVAVAGQPDAAVCYYGSGIGGRVEHAATSPARSSSTTARPTATSRPRRWRPSGAPSPAMTTSSSTSTAAPATPSRTSRPRCSTTPTPAPSRGASRPISWRGTLSLGER